MSRVSLATVLLISVLLGGCFGAPIAEWGSGTGEFETKWDNNPETLFNVTSKISESTQGQNTYFFTFFRGIGNSNV